MCSLPPFLFLRLDKVDKELMAIKTQKVLWGIIAENSDSNNLNDVEGIALPKAACIP